MKKSILILALAAIFCSSCKSEPAAQTTTQASSETTAQTSAETSAETTPTTTEETSAPETEASAEEKDRGEAVQPARDQIFDTEGMLFYPDEAEDNGDTLKFDYIYGFIASGFCDTSDLNPERFDVENYMYTPPEESEPSEYIELKEGETYGGAKIKTARTTLMRRGDEYGLLDMGIELEGEFEFEGTLNFYYDDEYVIGAGDMRFVPESGLKGLPLTAGCEARLQVTNGRGIYSEFSNGWSVGNLFSESPTRKVLGADGKRIELTQSEEVTDALNDMFGSETASCSKRAKVKLSNVTFIYSDQFGLLRCSANIEEIEEIK